MDVACLDRGRRLAARAGGQGGHGGRELQETDGASEELHSVICRDVDIADPRSENVPQLHASASTRLNPLPRLLH